jgi:glucuronoarabinoxylan endo-1,4-beta-xylanase
MKCRLARFEPLALISILLAAGGCGSGGGGAAEPPPTTAVTVGFDATTTYQTMVGFGAAGAYYADWPSLHPNSAALYQALFNDLGIQVLRIGNWNQNNSDNQASFNATVSLVKGAQATLGYTPVILMSSWNPLIALKSNGKNNAGGTLVKTASGGYDYASFGQWWSDSLAAYAAAGVVPDYISIQNEPDFTTTNEGTCLFDPAEDATNAGYGPALDAVRAAITAAGQPLPKFVGPETDGIASDKVTDYIDGMSPAQLGELDAVAHHLYNGGTFALPNSFNAALSSVTAAAGNLPTWMTEYSPNTPDMFNTAWLILNSVTVEGVSTYLYWDLFWPASKAGQPQEGLVGVEDPHHPDMWTTTNGFIISDSYYAVQHFAKWIGAGWQRVATTATEDGVKTTAFLSPDATQLTLVLLNTDGVDHQVTIDPSATAPFTTSNVYRTSGTAERASALGALPAGNVIDMPERSIATVTLGP